ncbi:hypothetical protein IW261DRAFT_1626337 [Armillaria novae-zelandiae]|uniref:Heterokaryon incompatibility domain-containing protein n=1 Tax=Armillaria novae-zelandiae TaxID=153914 RepID=A0AA39P938_9AGAR|nr:hypothetical protein IW261DRAFT_1626337 [Armillaria novae-zelandiae]
MDSESVRKYLPICDKHPPLTAFTEIGHAELTIPMLKQRSYTGNGAVIPSALANIPCAHLGIAGVYEILNAVVRPPYPLRSEVSREIKDRQIRKKVLVHDRITKSDMPPRRVWDLCANRVVPFWYMPSRVVKSTPQWLWSLSVWGISHAWVDKNDRMSVMTPINGKEWPVPMPKDTDLDLIRIEMLNLGAEFAWLDVLCLRQEGGEDEHLHFEEWKLDVPTIGFVYSSGERVVCYFNGLGRPLHLSPGYFKSEHCWFRRAWTLQEIAPGLIIGGETGDDVTEDDVRKKFDEQLTYLQQIHIRGASLELASEMQNRVSSKPLDKVAGLAYLLGSNCIPIYDADMSDSDAWEVLVDVMSSSSRAELFFYFPEPGNGRKYWRPSWQQILTMKHVWTSSCSEHVQHRDTDQDWYRGYFIDSADVRGLDEGLWEEMPHQGKMVFKTSATHFSTFKIFAHHSYPIPNGSYALISNVCEIYAHPIHQWVVGQIKKSGKFKKLSVFSSADADDEGVNLKEFCFQAVNISLC